MTFYLLCCLEKDILLLLWLSIIEEDFQKLLFIELSQLLFYKVLLNLVISNQRPNSFLHENLKFFLLFDNYITIRILRYHIYDINLK